MPLAVVKSLAKGVATLVPMLPGMLMVTALPEKEAGHRSRRRIEVKDGPGAARVGQHDDGDDFPESG